MNARAVLFTVMLVLTVCVFPGCSERKAGNEGRIRLQVAFWDASTTSFISDLKAAFEEANPDIVVEIIDIPSTDFTQKLQVMLNGGSNVVAFWIKDADVTKALANRGQLEDLAPYVARDGINLDDFKGLAQMFEIDGKLVAIPASTGYYILYYNKDIFDRAGVPYPSNDITWAEWEAIAGRLASGSGNGRVYGGLIHTWQACVQNWGVQNGINTIMDADLSFFIPYYEMALRMQRAGTVWDYGSLRAGGIHYSSAFLQGRVATMPMGTWFFSTILERIGGNENALRWGIATLPHSPGVEPGYTVGSVTPLAINRSSRNKDAAWRFVNFTTSAEGAAVYAKSGLLPARSDDAILQTITSTPGMPEGSLEALRVKNIALDRPIEDFAAEINQMLGEEHGLIMLEEVGIIPGIANMEKRSREIQGK